ncbi:MAG: GreA/GreB family elongation factor [Cyclobacteriaceae bacterium]|jgi:transcription elongation GreA/GreB family factor|nr:GreA/GreB family elongation factor [Cyclobacteriaceae bacterium]
MTQAIKQELLARCEQLVADRLQRLHEVIDQAARDAQTEQKSAMGDKYETGRAAAHLQQENASLQLAEAKKLREALRAIGPETPTTSVVPGSLVRSSHHHFFVAISMGAAYVDGTSYWVVSPQSPVGKSLLGKRVGESFVFQGQTEAILAIA